MPSLFRRTAENSASFVLVLAGKVPEWIEPDFFMTHLFQHIRADVGAFESVGASAERFGFAVA